MKLFTRILIPAVCALSISFLASAQDDGKMFHIADPDSLDVMLKTYIENTTSKHFEDPKVPRFLIADRNDNFLFGVGGYVGAKLFFDFNGSRESGFNPDHTNPQQSFDNSALDLDLTSTHILMKVLGKTKLGFIDAVMEADFSGTNKALKLAKAYIDFCGFRIGIAQTAFQDDESINLIDGKQYYSKTNRSVPSVSYSHRFQDKFRVQGAVEFPQSTTAYYLGEVVPVSSSISDFAFGSSYYGSRVHLFAGADLRLIQYANIPQATVEYKVLPAYAFQLSGNVDLFKGPRLQQTLYFQAVWTNGLADCMSNLRDKGLNIVMPNMLGGHFIQPKAVGSQLAYQFQWGVNSVNLSASGDYVYGHENIRLDTLHRFGGAFSANYIRQIIKYGTVGFEAIYGFNAKLNMEKICNFRSYIYFRYDF